MTNFIKFITMTVLALATTTVALPADTLAVDAIPSNASIDALSIDALSTESLTKSLCGYIFTPFCCDATGTLNLIKTKDQCIAADDPTSAATLAAKCTLNLKVADCCVELPFTTSRLCVPFAKLPFTDN